MDRDSNVLYKSNMAALVSIPNYNLFGETGDLPDVVHCETIQTRSLLHDWIFAPHRHARLHQILFIDDGGGRASFDGQEQALLPQTLINVPMGHVHGFEFVPGTSGLVVTLAAETLDATLQATEGLAQVLGRVAVIAATAECVSAMQSIAETHARRDFARAQLLRSLAGLLLGLLARELHGFHSSNTDQRAQSVLARFEALLEQHFREHWSVALYAQALNISPTHLSRVTRSATGLPVTKHIRDRLVREARRNLVYTNLSISAIAFALGFSDPAYFSRVFTDATGLSPSTFRARVAGAVD